MYKQVIDALNKLRKKKSANDADVEATVDNFDLIKSLLKFNDKGDFYFLQIILRKKDGFNDPGANRNNGYRTVKSYYIKSVAEFDNKRKEITQLCNQNHARAYINLNVRNMRNVLFSMSREIPSLLEDEQYDKGFRVLEHCCGITPKKGIKKTWIVDVDTKDHEVGTVVKSAVNMCRSNNKVDDEHYDNIVAVVPTRAGWHLITVGFDKSKLKENITAEADRVFGAARKERFSDEMIEEICDSVKKDNPTLLYFKK